MAKRAKRQKAKLRKGGTDAEVAAHHERVEAEARTGGELSVVPDDLLFTLDTTPAAAGAAGAARPSRAAKKAAARAHTLAVDQVLTVKSPHQYPNPGVHKKAGANPQGITTLKKLLDTKPHVKKALVGSQAAASGPKRKGAKAYDMWNAEDYNVNNAELLSTLAKKAPVTKKMAGVKPLNQIAPVELDAAGCSFNPPVNAHQEVLAVAVAEEMAKEFKKELAPKKNDLTATALNELVEDEIYRTHVDESEDEEEGKAGPANEDESEEAQLARAAKVVVNKKKTKAERNKDLLKKERQREHAAAVSQKRIKSQVNNIKAIQKELDEADTVREHKRQRKLAVKAEKASKQPRRLGKRLFEAEPLQVQLTEEVTGSMRQLKGCPTLVRDRFKSFQKRELIEPRVQQTARKSRRFQTVETGTKGEKEREGHYAIMAERALGRSML